MVVAPHVQSEEESSSDGDYHESSAGVNSGVEVADKEEKEVQEEKKVEEEPRKEEKELSVDSSSSSFKSADSEQKRKLNAKLMAYKKMLKKK